VSGYTGKELNLHCPLMVLVIGEFSMFVINCDP